MTKNAERPAEPQITKRRVRMADPRPIKDPETDTWVVPPVHEVVDYVPDDERDGVNVLERYVADARTRWNVVEVGDLDAGPAGYHGATHIPAQLDHPAAGRTYAATEEA